MILYIILLLSSIIVNLGVSIYTIIKYTELENINIEDEDRNRGEFIWLCINIALIILFSILLILNECNVIKRVPLKEFYIFILCITIITTSLSWDFFSRSIKGGIERDVMMSITIILFCIFFYILDKFYANLTAQSIGSSTFLPDTFSPGIEQFGFSEQK